MVRTSPADAPGLTEKVEADALAQAHRELLTLHELIAHRLVQIRIGQHRGRVFFT